MAVDKQDHDPQRSMEASTTLSGPKFALLNDTRDQPHFGCHCVIENIHQALNERGAYITGSSLAGTRWEKNTTFLKSLKECDAILINGEGTLHHGNHRAERLLQVVDHPLRGKKPVFIINALYQDNPKNWERYLNNIAFIYARDNRSFKELASIYSGRLGQALDLSLYAAFDHKKENRFVDYVIYGDSFYPSISQRLLSTACKDAHAAFIPIMTSIKSRKANLAQPLRSFRDGYISIHAALHKLRYSKLYFASAAPSYLAILRAARIHVTGRFHGACLSLLAETPPLILTSNSWKVEALIEDIGLSEKRIIRVEELETLNPRDDAHQFSSLELIKLKKALKNNRKQVSSIFDQIISIVKQ